MTEGFMSEVCLHLPLAFPSASLALHLLSTASICLVLHTFPLLARHYVHVWSRRHYRLRWLSHPPQAPPIATPLHPPITRLPVGPDARLPTPNSRLQAPVVSSLRSWQRSTDRSTKRLSRRKPDDKATIEVGQVCDYATRRDRPVQLCLYSSLLFPVRWRSDYFSSACFRLFRFPWPTFRCVSDVHRRNINFCINICELASSSVERAQNLGASSPPLLPFTVSVEGQHQALWSQQSLLHPTGLCTPGVVTVFELAAISPVVGIRFANQLRLLRPRQQQQQQQMHFVRCTSKEAIHGLTHRPDAVEFI
ncbi:unnamed protein product [Protopolystoma xenopodis]|uniref:Uncharacterized protein n=1 Tax=Protopolystoma xenopodis TaxID=117903 RepID=A0A3S5CMH7_9PLAT|nr:unnamed protein product [Protopolystoma xenopodis]